MNDVQSFIPVYAIILFMFCTVLFNCIFAKMFTFIANAKKGCRILLIEAVLYYILCAFAAYLLFTNADDFYLTEKFCFISGLALVGLVSMLRSVSLRRADGRYQTYMETIKNGSTVNIQELSETLSTKSRIVEKELKDLMAKGYLSNIHFITNTPHVLQVHSDAPEESPSPSPSKQAPQKKVVQCRHCGASKIITEGDTSSECDYCKMPLL